MMQKDEQFFGHDFLVFPDPVENVSPKEFLEKFGEISIFSDIVT